jgi:phage tail-like protein
MPKIIPDPATSLRFHVQIGDIVEAAFSECSGLQAEIAVETYAEGGLNDAVHRLPGRANFTNVRLSRGIAASDALLRWWKDTLRGKFTRKDVSIVLYSAKGEEMARWTLSDALPVKWVAPTMRGGESSVAVESLELAFEAIDYE